MVSLIEYLVKNTILIHIIFLVFIKHGYAAEDTHVYKVKSGNQTVHVYWTFSLNVDDPHILQCVAQKYGSQNENPLLKWGYGIDKKEFRGNDTILVDTTKPNDTITLKFTKMDYTMSSEFYCIAYDEKNGTITIRNFTIIDIHVKKDTSGWIIFGWLFLLLIFMTGAVAICRTFRFNYYATQMEF